MGCNGNCGSCGGCASTLSLTQWELDMLDALSQCPFLPVARKASEETPVYLEEDAHSIAEYGLILLCLEKKGLVEIDYRQPLSGFAYEAYAGYPVHGTVSLTARGQQVVELLAIQGIE